VSDIVERLCDGEHCTVGCAKLRAEAAAEIERLRNALQRIAAFEADPYRQEAGDDADACARIAAHALQWRGVTAE